MSVQILSLERLAALIDEKRPRCICGATLQSSHIRHYGPHEGGIHVEGFEEKRWVYVKCSTCGYDVALHKIWRELA
ncbi:MAG: hypothetical protein ABIJ47_06960 [Candidatus Bathyarchaeota archaeon]